MVIQRAGLLSLCVILAMMPAAFAEDASLAHKDSIENNANALAAQSRSMLTLCILNSGCPDSTIPQTAEDVALQALALDPSHIEARLQLAIALSMKARDMPMGEARKGRFAERMRDYASGVLEDDPDNSWAHGFLAVWHVEVRRRGGVIGAAILGASLKDAEQHFREVRKTAPEYLVLSWQYARALAALDAERHESRIAELLGAVVRQDSGDPLEQAVRQRAQTLLDAVEASEFGHASAFAKLQM